MKVGSFERNLRRGQWKIVREGNDYRFLNQERLYPEVEEEETDLRRLEAGHEDSAFNSWV